MTTFQINTRFETRFCGHCSFEFGVSTYTWKRWERENTEFYCPSCRGPMRHGSQSEADRLRAQARKLEHERDMARRSAAAAKRRASAQKGQVTRLKKRAANGVCPCCNRTFQNLHRHMTSQHPDFAEASK